MNPICDWVPKVGASAITVHGRTKDQRNKGQVHLKEMQEIFEHVSIAIIGNGGIEASKVRKTLRR
jgi:tRNA-dihydrouridine synthase